MIWKKNKVGRSVKEKFFFIILLVKNVCFMHVDLELGGLKKLKGRDFFESKLVMVGLQETNHFF